MNPLSRALRTPLARTAAFACIALGATAALGLAAARAADPPPAPRAAAETGAPRMGRHIQAHLDQLSERLEIKASQEPAWQAFANAFKDAMTSMVPPEPGSAPPKDAAAMIRSHADRAQEHARKLAALADAADKLQQTLGPDQRQVFNEVARHFAREHLGMHMAMHGMMGHHGESESEDHCDGDGRGHGYDGHHPMHDGDGMSGGEIPKGPAH
jgi:hypothetical protein